jgi:hypothetical protein
MADMFASALNSNTQSSFAKLSERILTDARSPIDRFERKLLEILHSELDLAGCCIYSESPYADLISLRGRVGFSEDVLLALAPMMNSAADLALHSPIVIPGYKIQPNNCLTEVSEGPVKPDQVVVLATLLPNVASGKRSVSLICLGTKKDKRDDQIEEFANSLRRIVELAFEISVDFTLRLLWEQILDRAIHSSDASSFLYRVLRLMQDEWSIQAGSAFVFDPRARCLRLAATTGLNLVGIEKRDVFYRLTETEHQTVRSFVKRNCLIINQADIANHPPKYRERLSGNYHSALVAPFFSSRRQSKDGARVHGQCLGVLRLVNRQVFSGAAISAADFTWEDAKIVDFLCKTVAVVTNLYQEVAQKGSDFERVTHGLETSMLTVIGALHNVNDNVDCASVFPAFLRHSIPNAIAFTESIHEQIRIFNMRDVHQLEDASVAPVKLFGDIISAIPTFVKNSGRFFGVSAVKIDYSSFFENEADASRKRVKPVPMVYADQHLLLAVFKNLIENAIKYSRPDAPCFIKLDWRAEDDFVDVLVSDSGMGISFEDEEFIFNETYRGENAVRRRAQGTGLGLYQCALIMDRLGGSVTYRHEVNHPEGLVTTFTVRIPRRRLRD